MTPDTRANETQQKLLLLLDKIESLLVEVRDKVIDSDELRKAERGDD